MTSPWTNQLVELVIISAPVGAFAGIFVYSPKPALGNLIGSWAAQAGTDPFGNAYPQGLNVKVGSITGTTFMGTNFIINSSGMFFYSGTPALGNLILSATPAAGTDSFGNAFVAGFGAYNPATSQEIAIGLNVANNRFGVLFQSTGGSPSLAPPNISSPFDTTSGTAMTLNSGLGVARPTDNDANLIISSQLQAAVTGGSIILGAGRVILGNVGQLFWDDNAGQLLFTAGGTGPFISGEGFHTVTLPTTGGFSGQIRVKKVPWNMVFLDCQITWNNTAGGTFTCGSLPDATYYPTVQVPRSYPISTGDSPNSDLLPRIIVPSAGALSIFVGSSGAGSGTTAFSGISVFYPTN